MLERAVRVVKTNLSGLLLQKDCEDPAEVAPLNGVHRVRVVQEPPEFHQQVLVANKRIANLHHLAAKNFRGEARVPLRKRRRRRRQIDSMRD